MSLHWPSFFLGAAALPLAAMLLFLVLRAIDRVSGRSGAARLDRPPAAPGTLEPLHFTKRLIGQIERPSVEVEESARAS